jgi:hypothetical protein
VAASSLVLATAGIAFAVRALEPGGSPAGVSVEPSGTPPLTGEPVITAEIPLAAPDRDDPIGGVAVGAGSVWIGRSGPGPGDRVARIDLATNQVVAEIPVERVPSRGRIVATDGAVWIAEGELLERIDPTTDAVAARVALPGRASAMAADASAVWVVTVGDGGGTLVRADPAADAIVAEIPLGPEIAGDDEVVVGAEAVWVLGVRWSPEGDVEHGGDLIRVDPETNTVAARIPLGGFHVAAGADEVWVRFPADGAFDGPDERWLWTRVDARTNQPSPPFEFEAAGLDLVTPEVLWSVEYDEEEHVRVTGYDPRTLDVVARSDRDSRVSAVSA